MDVTIEQHLDNMAKRLKQDKETLSLGYDIESFSRQFTKLMVELRQCREVSANLNKAVTTFIPEGKKLGQSVWNTFEAYGMWTPEREEITDRLTSILSGENILNEIVDSTLMGCECRKKG